MVMTKNVRQITRCVNQRIRIWNREDLFLTFANVLEIMSKFRLKGAAARCDTTNRKLMAKEVLDKAEGNMPVRM